VPSLLIIFGCYIDIVLVAPSATALRKMLAIGEDYADEYCICFNAAKSKCLVILPNYRRSSAKELYTVVLFTLPINP